MSRILIVVIALFVIVAGSAYADKQTVKLTHRALTSNALLDKLGNPSMMMCTPAFGLLGSQGNPPGQRTRRRRSDHLCSRCCCVTADRSAAGERSSGSMRL